MYLSAERESELISELKSSHVMHWNYRDYHSLPHLLLSHGQHVSDLYAKSNNLVSLPAWIDQLTNLTEMYLGGNRLTSLPENIGGLVNLRVLHVDENSLSRVPESLGELRNLNDINLEGNRLVDFPSGLRRLKAVYIVNVRRNRILTVPEWLTEMVSLQELIIDYNLLICLPLNIVYAKSLTYLSVCSNRILYLPFLPFFNEITLEFWGNPSLNYIWRPYVQNESNVARCMGYPKNLRVKTRGISPCNDRLRNLKLLVREFNETICLPMPVKRLFSSHGHRQPSSLLELTLRSVYYMIFIVDDFGGRRCIRPEVKNELTSHLAERLMLGPFARCSCCQIVLFSEAVIELRRVDRRPCRMIRTEVSYITAEFYCLSNCSARKSSDSLEWSVVED